MAVSDLPPREALDHVLSEFQAQARGEKGLALNIPCLRKDGTVVYAEINSTQVRMDGKECIIGFFTDVTERRQMEEERDRLEAQLRQRQRLASVGTLAGGVAHEINNPIGGIMGYAQLIADTLDAESQLSEYAREIIAETERVATIVRNLLVFSGREEQQRSPARMTDIVDVTLSLIEAGVRHDQTTLEVDVPEDLPKVKCRSQQIQQVLMNLLTNAREALNARYPGHDPDKIIRTTAREIEKEGKRWIRTTVEDHGIGIPEEIRDHLFDPFFTTKSRAESTGLGLTISHGIVQAHGGELHVESEVGKYTRVHLDLAVDDERDLHESKKDERNE